MESKQKNLILGGVAAVALIVGGYLIFSSFRPPAPAPVKANSPRNQLIDQLQKSEQEAAKKRPPAPPPPEEVNAEPGSGRKVQIPGKK